MIRPTLGVWLAIATLFGPSRSAAESQAWLTVVVSVEKSTITWQKGASLQLDVLVKDADGQGMPGLTIQLDASDGSLSAPLDKHDGHYQATYHLPSRSHPQAIILMALAPGGAPGWTVLRVRSPVELPVDTSKPNVNVSLKLGPRTYGPVRSDQRGRARIPVEVGPGESQARAVAVDEFGNATQRNVQIPLPRSPRMAGLAERHQLAADGYDASPIYLIGVKPDGRPDDEMQFSTKSGFGQLSGAERVGPGMYRFVFTAPSQQDLSSVSVNLAERSAPRQNHRQFDFRLVAGKPHRIAFNAQTNALFADGISQTLMDVMVYDRADNALEGLQPEIRCDNGLVGPLHYRGSGRFQAQYTAPLSTSGSATCQVSLDYGGLEKLTARLTLELKAPVPGQMTVRLDNDRLVQDGRSSTRIRISVKDTRGRPLSGVAIQGQAAIGKLAPIYDNGGGEYGTVYTAPAGSQDTKVRIAFEAGEEPGRVVAAAVVTLDRFVPPPPPAPVLLLGPSLIYSTNFGYLQYGAVELAADWRIPGLAEMLYAGLEIGYRFGWKSDSWSATAERSRLHIDAVPLHLRLKFKPWPRNTWSPFVSLAGGIQSAWWALQQGDVTIEKKQAWLASSQVGLGCDLRLGFGMLTVSVRYGYAFLDQRGDTEQGVQASGSHVVGNIAGLDLVLGVHLAF